MATKRDNPYGAFNFRVEFGDVAGGGPIDAGFSDVSGLGNEVNYSEYRSGTDKFNTVRKVPTRSSSTKSRSSAAWSAPRTSSTWIKAVRDGQYQPRTVTIVMLDEARNEVLSLVLKNAQPKKWVGPTLAAKGGGEVALEELHLVHEGIEYE